jgi:hypothetical protein
MHRVVLYRSGRTESPDHGEHLAALEAIGGRNDHSYGAFYCAKRANYVRARAEGDNVNAAAVAFAEDPSKLMPLRFMPLCAEISMERARKALSDFRFNPAAFADDPSRYAADFAPLRVASEPFNVKLLQWKRHLRGVSYASGVLRIGEGLAGDAYQCCMDAAALAATRSRRDGLLACARVARVPTGCTASQRHIAVALSDPSGNVRLVHGIGAFVYDSCQVPGQGDLGRLWASIAFEHDAIVGGHVDLKLWSIVNMARHLQQMESTCLHGSMKDPPRFSWPIAVTNEAGSVTAISARNR